MPAGPPERVICTEPRATPHNRRADELEKKSGTLEQVLTLEEVAAWLKVSPRQVLRYDVPCLDLGHKTKRFLACDVVAWLEGQRSGA